MLFRSNEDLQPVFKNHFSIPDKIVSKKKGNDDDSVGRAIYGFLCFDHQQINYFNTDVDINIGYVFADILSIFLIQRLIYTEYSKTFQKAQEIINK